MKKWMSFVLAMQAALLFGQNFNLELLGHKSYFPDLNDVWGYTDEEGNEYALVGTVFGFSIVDVTDATNLTEVANINGNYTIWRDIKTWGDYAYVTCECSNGLLIVDLSPLPQSTNLSYTYWKSDTTYEFSSAHNLFIDENGIAYIFGANKMKGGAIMLDLTQDPMNPVELGIYNDAYLHDGVVRGDTLWGSAVYEGKLQVIDVSDKANPQLLSAWTTPNAFTHNAWFSDDNKYIFTTDEVKNGRIAAYDVSNIYNPKEVDTWMPNDTAIIPHNAHFIDDYLVISHYTVGLVVLDVKRPNNMKMVASYDTSPNYHYEGFYGCWGAYPWLPSGKILATDIEEGLYVFQPNYQRACYLEGAVTDEHTGGVIFFPTIEIIEDSLLVTGSLTGKYAVSTLDAGTYSVKVSADGYFDKIINNVQLTNGQLTILDVQLSNWPLGLEELDADGFQLMPNPADDVVSMRASEPIQSVFIYSLSGVLVGEFQPKYLGEKAEIRVNGLSSGVYVLQVKVGSKLLNKRLVVR